MKGVYALTEDIKKEDVKEEEVVQATEEVVEESNQPSELEEAQARAEEFENKYLRAHAEMQNIQRRANEERQQLQKYRSQDLAKAILPSLDNLERALAVEGLTDDVKKGLEMVQESLVHALKEEGIEEGIKQGIIEKSKEKTKQLFNKYYPKEDDSILENLNNEQYDKIFEMILDNRSINEIKGFLK